MSISLYDCPKMNIYFLVYCAIFPDVGKRRMRNDMIWWHNTFQDDTEGMMRLKTAEYSRIKKTICKIVASKNVLHIFLNNNKSIRYCADKNSSRNVVIHVTNLSYVTKKHERINKIWFGWALCQKYRDTIQLRYKNINLILNIQIAYSHVHTLRVLHII